VKIYLDVEGDPITRIYYLIGVLIDTGESITNYSFWVDDQAEFSEKAQDFLAEIQMFKKFRLYHY